MKNKTDRRFMALVMATVIAGGAVASPDRAELQRRESFRKLEDLRAKAKEDAGEDVNYRKRDGELRPHGLMDDITEPGQSTAEMNRIKTESTAEMNRMMDQEMVQDYDHGTAQSAEIIRKKDGSFEPKFQRDNRDFQEKVNSDTRKKLYQDRLNEEQSRRQLDGALPQGYEQGAVDDGGRYAKEAQDSIKKHQDATQIQYDSVSFEDAVKMSDAELKNKKEIVIKLEDTYDMYKKTDLQNNLDRVMTAAQDATLVLDCGDATEIKYGALSNERRAKKIKVVGAGVRKIGDDFLASCESLTSVDLSPLSNVTQIGNAFLSGCKSLTSVDLRPLSNVAQIGYGFLRYCESLTSVDLSPLSNVTQIGNAFLSGCKSLTSVDLRPLSNVTQIREGFLTNCISLTSVDLSELSHVTQIGHYFLSDCKSLTSVDLRALSHVTQIGDAFFSGCRSLASVDLTPLSHVTRIGYNFLTGCESLTSVDLTPLSNVKQIGDYSLYGCKSLTSVTIPQDWRFKDQVERSVSKDVKVVEGTLTDFEQSAPTEGPRRPGSDYTTAEYNQASTLMQGVREIDQSSAAYLAKLETVFSHDRAFKILQDIQSGDVHLSDSD